MSAYFNSKTYKGKWRLRVWHLDRTVLGERMTLAVRSFIADSLQDAITRLDEITKHGIHDSVTDRGILFSSTPHSIIKTEISPFSEISHLIPHTDITEKETK